MAMPHVILFEHPNFRGAHKHVFAAEETLDFHEDKFFNDRVSSIVVLEGNWQFYRHSNFQSPYGKILGPGRYSWVEAFGVGITNDDLSSLKPVG
jgi:hypothetical protein